ncbi:MAG: universal stress protein [Haloarculaceae archaeon]
MSDEELAKDLGLVSAMTIGIGTMIGAGIFVLPGVAANAAGPVVVVSFVVGGLIAMVNALSVSELGTAMPKAGGGYYYINRSLGPLFGSIAGMGDWMGLAFASAFYCIGFGQYLAVFVPLPEVAFLNPIQMGALLAGIVFVGVNFIGAKETGGVQTVIVFVLLSILTAFAVAGFLSFDYATLAGEDGLAPFGTEAILPATALVFVSFLGYAKIATVAEELKNPGRNLPIAIIGSDADTVVMGYGGARFAGGRAEAALEELTHDLPCDFLVLDGQDLELSDVLVPTAGGASSDLSAEVAGALRETVGVDVSLLHVVDPGEEDTGREFLNDWAESHGLADADLRVEAGDVETVIGRVGETYSLVIIGSTDRGLLSRIVRGSLAFDAIQALETPVLLAERPSARSLRERLFGRR